MGWYATIVYEYLFYDRFMHTLYNNMPASLTNIMWIAMKDNDNGNDILLYDNHNNNAPQLDFTSTHSLLIMALSHALDLLAHPLLTYYFWRKHSQGGGGGTTHTLNGGGGGTLKQVLSWPVIVSAYLFSRCWSMTHTYYNFQRLEWFYVGHDVYMVKDLDCWYPAYIAESAIFLSVVVWKICWEESSSSEEEDDSNSSKPQKLSDTTVDESSNSRDHKPSLVASESTASTTSTDSRAKEYVV
jgi:hypothetical protein